MLTGALHCSPHPVAQRAEPRPHLFQRLTRLPFQLLGMVMAEVLWAAALAIVVHSAPPSRHLAVGFEQVRVVAGART
jgi:hypothetical protein